MSDGIHVMRLSHHQQECLWLMLYNLHALFLRQQMDKLASFDDDRAVQQRHAVVMTSLDDCLDIMNLIKEAGKRERVFFFPAKNMSLIAASLHNFDEKNNYLHADDLSFAQREYAGFRDLVANSMQFSYTRDELRKAGLKV